MGRVIAANGDRPGPSRKRVLLHGRHGYVHRIRSIRTLVGDGSKQLRQALGHLEDRRRRSPIGA
eukprot:1715564-Pleurochrysis_carterae.AAC.1